MKLFKNFLIKIKLKAMGITEISNILMVLGISNKMKEEEREVMTSLMIQGK